MEDDDDKALEAILEEQAALKQRLAGLDREIAALKVARRKSASPEPAAPAAEAPVDEVASAPVEKKRSLPPPLPPAVREPAPQPVAEAGPESSTRRSPGGFEFQLGTFWLVRVGIVMLLTGLVFLARHFLTSEHVGAGLKIAGLYLASFALLGAGSWIEKTRESMRNFGQVLGAGGLAAVYFTTFAAHKFPSLAVISSNLVAGVLLLLWAGFMVVLADRKRSQTLAIMGVLLAYYTLLIDEVSLFSLWSALILSGVALVFLVRNRWTAVGSLALAGTYLAFAYWRFPELLSWLNHAPAAPGRFWPEYGFLICYWAVFTAAAFLCNHLDERRRSALAGLNNAAFLVFFGLGTGRHYPDAFWLFALAAGFVFLVLSELADRRLGRGALLGTAYLATGLTLVTLAFFIKLSGYSLAILLAAQSCALLVVATQRRSAVLEAGAYLCALLALFYTVSSELAGPLTVWFVQLTEGIPAAAAFAQLLFFTFGAWWVRNRAANIAKGTRFEPRASLLLALGIAAAVIGAWGDVGENMRALLFLAAGAGAAALGSWPRLRLAELAVLGQALSAVAIGTCLIQLSTHERVGPLAPSLPASLAFLLLLMGLLHWVRSSRSPAATLGVRPALEWGFAVAWSLALILTLQRHFDPGAAWLYLPGLLALAQLLYGFRARIPALAVLSQFFHAVALLRFEQNESPLIGALPLVLLLANISVADHLRRRSGEVALTKTRADLLDAGFALLRVLAFFFFCAFAFEHVHSPWRPLSFALAALAVHGVAIRRHDRQRLVFALLLLGSSALMLLVRALDKGAMGDWQYYLAALAPLAAQRLSRRFGGPAAHSPVYHWILACAAVGLSWLAVSVDVSSIGGGFYLTASWSLLGLIVFGAGWFLRERPYRLLSLALLGAALLRLLAVEVWSLDPVARIITFLLIGFVLLALGFVYTRFQEKLRQIF